MKKIAILLLIVIISGIVYLKRSAIPVKIDDTTRQIENVIETVAPQPTTIQPDGLPDKHLISTHFVPQAPEKNWDQPWQDACEEAALLTVRYNYTGLTPSVPEIVADLRTILDEETNAGFSHDVSLAQLSRVADTLWGYRSEIIDNPTIEEIKQYLADDVPVIATANGKTLYQENKRFRNGGPWYHAVVILGYDDSNQKFTVHDVGTQFGAYFKYSYSLLMESIHDFPESLKKEDINSGAKRVMVLVK